MAYNNNPNQTPKRKQVSYNQYEMKPLEEMEKKLMKVYHCGYSQLMKTLVREKAEMLSKTSIWNG